MTARMFLLRKLPSVILVLFGVTFLTYLLVNALPGNIAAVMLGDQATPAAIAELTVELGLDRPVLIRYAEWLGHALRGDLGTSMATGQGVVEAISQRAFATIELTVLALLFAVLGAIALSVATAAWPGGWFDWLVSAFVFVLLASPPFLVGLLGILVLAVGLEWFPASGWVSFTTDPIGNLQAAVLPTLALGTGPLANYTRLLRGDIVEQMTRSDYVVMARAKGVGEGTILLRHVLRNSMFPLLTNVGLTAGLLVGGSVVVEGVFAVPGIGRLMMQAIGSRDVPMVVGVVIVIASTVVLINLVVEVLYGVLNPKVRHERGY